mgnify:CR=1 FL=1
MLSSQRKIQERLEFEVRKEDRLDRFLSHAYPELSRSYIKELIEEGFVLVDGKEVKKPACRLRVGQKVVLLVPEPEPLELKPENIPIDILYEDEHIMVVVKPCGLVSHPSPGYTSGTLVNALLYHAKSLSSVGGVQRPGIVHRLDRNTAGLMVVAKTDIAHRNLSEQFASRKVEKYYRALVWELLEREHMVIEEGITRDRKDRKRFTVSQEGRHAKTELWLLKAFPKQRLSLLKVKIHTGRTHQIRVHLSHLGHPILGDYTYGFQKSMVDERVLKAMKDCHMLLSFHLGFYHPVSGEFLTFQIQDPEPFKSTLSLIEELEEKLP